MDNTAVPMKVDKPQTKHHAHSKSTKSRDKPRKHKRKHSHKDDSRHSKARKHSSKSKQKRSRHHRSDRHELQDDDSDDEDYIVASDDDSDDEEVEDDGMPVVYVNNREYEDHGGDNAMLESSDDEEDDTASMEVPHAVAIQEEKDAQARTDDFKSAISDFHNRVAVARDSESVDPAVVADGESNYKCCPFEAAGDFADAEVIKDPSWCFHCHVREQPGTYGGNPYFQSLQQLGEQNYGVVSNSRLTEMIQDHYNSHLRPYISPESQRKPWAKRTILAHIEEHAPTQLTDTVYSLRILRGSMRVLDKSIKMQSLTDPTDFVIHAGRMKLFMSLLAGTLKMSSRADGLRDTAANPKQ